MMVKMPDASTISIYPRIDSSFSDILSLPDFSMIDKQKYFLKSNSPIKLISEQHRLTTLYLIPRLRGGSYESDKIIAELQERLNQRDKENEELTKKVDLLMKIMGKSKVKSAPESESDSEDTPMPPDVEELTPIKNYFSSTNQPPSFKNFDSATTVSTQINKPQKIKFVLPGESQKEPEAKIQRSVIEVETSKSVKAAKCHGLSVYDGSQEWEDWIKQFNLCALKWSLDLKLVTFISYMSKDIKVVLRNVDPQTLNNFEKLTKLVKELFDTERKSPTDFLKELLISDMNTTNCKNVSQGH
jgi:hypothetical protein